MDKFNTTAVFLVCTVLVITVLFIPGPVSGVLLLLVAAMAGVLLLATWHRMAPLGRAARLAVLAMLVLLAVSRFA